MCIRDRTKEPHNLDVTNPVTLSGIAFTCSGSTGITTTIFPDPQQSYVVDTVIGDVGTSKTFSAVVGSSKGYPHFYNSAIHFYERSRANAVEVGTGTTGGYTSFTASPGTTYNPVTGILGITTASHGLSVGDLIRIDDVAITFTCSQDGNSTNHPYPRATDPASTKLLPIISKTTNTFSVDVGTSSNTTTHNFVSGVANGIHKINTRFNVINAVYNGGPNAVGVGTTFQGFTGGLAAGDLVLTLDKNHNLSADDKIRIAVDSIIFSCTMDNRATEHAYPRKTDPAVPTPRSSSVDPDNKNGDLTVSTVGLNGLRVNVGVSPSGGYFAPLQMELIASILENSTA